jgi:CheY-like chemotaxis protein
VDSARFESALLNLVLNARDAMPMGGTLTIAAANVELGDGQFGNLKAGTYVNVSVSDTGNGMPPEVAARAFEPFFTTKEIGKGTGLGLSQVHGFIAQSDGEVQLDSTVGKGTTVNIYLPALSGTIEVRDTDTDTEKETVLIVEDEPNLLEMAAELFRSMGYHVHTAGNGRDGLDILKREPHIDVLFSDVMMPLGMSGIQLAQTVRELYPHIRIILASGYPLPALKAQHGNLDDFSFMTKPYRMAELVKELRAG